VWIRRLHIENLRNLISVDLTLGPRLNYFHGDNGAGKTALLEAVHLLGRGRSFRSGVVADLIRYGADGLLVRAELEDEHRGRVAVGMSRTRDGRGELRIDGHPGRRLSDVSALLPLQAMTPSLSALVFGGPAERRQWLDWGLFHVEPDHLRSLRQYLHALRQRNAALKSVALGQLPESALSVWTDEALEWAESVTERRRSYLERLVPELERTLAELAPSLSVSIRYAPGWPGSGPLRKVLGESQSRELKYGATQSGPHRADVEILTNGAAAGTALSRGQGKAVASALMLAQARLLWGSARRASVFLIDDLGAELDLAHNERLFGLLGDLGAQILATSSLGPELWRSPAGLPLTVFHVEHGRVTQS
jgi:DNA replication and repair protein RecF